MTKLSKYERSGQGLAECPRCGAKENNPCYAPSGAPAQPHQDRMDVDYSEHSDKSVPPHNAPLVVKAIYEHGAFRVGDSNHIALHYTDVGVSASCGAAGRAVKTNKYHNVLSIAVGVINCVECLGGAGEKPKGKTFTVGGTEYTVNSALERMEYISRNNGDMFEVLALNEAIVEHMQ